MELKGKKVLVAGTGLSGIAAAQLLLQMGADTILYDSNEKLCREEIRAKSDALKEIPVVLGELDICLARQLDLAVLSPGVPLDAPAARQLADAGVPLCEGPSGCDYRYERQDNDDGAGGGDFEKPFCRCKRGRQYRDPLYVAGGADDG